MQISDIQYIFTELKSVTANDMVIESEAPTSCVMDGDDMDEAEKAEDDAEDAEHMEDDGDDEKAKKNAEEVHVMK